MQAQLAQFYSHDGDHWHTLDLQTLPIAPYLAELEICAPSSPTLYQLQHTLHAEHYSLMQQRAIARLLSDAIPTLQGSHGVILEELVLTPGHALEELHSAAGRWEQWYGVLQEQVTCWVLVDGAACDPIEVLQLLSADIFRDVRLILRWPTELCLEQQEVPCWGWERNSAQGGLQAASEERWSSSGLGVVLPCGQAPAESYIDIVRLLELCSRHKIVVRLIPEEVLHCSWQELGALAGGTHQSTEGLRKLAGFVATGGAMLTVQEACCYAEGGEFPEWE